MGAGKTTVASLLAEAWGVTARDTDADVEVAEGRTISDIFVDSGEARFRELERAAVADALAEHTGVLALGGGAVISDATRRLLVEQGRNGVLVVWLDVDLHSAARRVGLSRDRPILGVNPRAMLRHMLETRAPLYDEVATLQVSTGDREPADVVAEVLAALAGRPVAP
jgi:shikimate kinase